MTDFRSIRAGVETLALQLSLPRHRHREGYATVLLAGSMTEASFAGRFRAEPGDVLLHGRFDCHGNWAAGRQPPQILRLPWFDDGIEGRFGVMDPDLLARTAERDPHAATALLAEALLPAEHTSLDWPERLADDLAEDPSLSITGWATHQGIAPATVSRGFRDAFGVSPRTFRLEARTRKAWRAVMGGVMPLTTLAYEHGFADQAHLSRSIRALTGLSPSQWRHGSHQLRSRWTIAPPVVSRTTTAREAPEDRMQ